MKINKITKTCRTYKNFKNPKALFKYFAYYRELFKNKIHAISIIIIFWFTLVCSERNNTGTTTN